MQACRPTARQRAAGVLATGEGVLSVLRYVERNLVRPGLVTAAESWRWSSLWAREAPAAAERPWLRAPAGGVPGDWAGQVNRPQSEKELAALRRCVQRGAPFGREPWVKRMAKELGLTCTLRPRGRPRKRGDKGS